MSHYTQSIPAISKGSIIVSDNMTEQYPTHIMNSFRDVCVPTSMHAFYSQWVMSVAHPFVSSSEGYLRAGGIEFWELALQ